MCVNPGGMIADKALKAAEAQWELGLCGCGCGTPVKRRFVHNHHPRKTTTADSVLARLVACKPTVLDTGCWEWTGTCSPNGYGRVCIKGRHTLPHRFMYEHTKGPIPEGLQIDHRCGNRRCANPDHLEAVTPAENQRLVHDPPKTTCPLGHPYEGDNLMVTGRGDRYCKRCHYARHRKWRASNAGAASPRISAKVEER